MILDIILIFLIIATPSSLFKTDTSKNTSTTITTNKTTTETTLPSYDSLTFKVVQLTQAPLKGFVLQIVHVRED